MSSDTGKTKSCAYCGGRGPFTREHIVPAFLYREYPDQKFGLHQRSARYVSYEAKIRDVCGPCNSGPLSDLDAYGQAFTFKNRCGKTYRRRVELSVTYDHRLLLRWLLKMSFNAMRANLHDLGTIQPWIPFILHGGSPAHPVRILLEIVRDHPIGTDEGEGIDEEFRKEGFIPARGFRIGSVEVGASRWNGLFRFVSINAYYFFVVSADSDDNLSDGVRALKSNVPQAQILSPTTSCRTLRVSKRTTYDANLHQKLLELPLWLKHNEESE